MTEPFSELAVPKPSVHEAWARVMADCTHLAKSEFQEQQRFAFRGIDGVMNVVGPALRKHQVAVIPTHVAAAHRDVQTSTGKPSREATVQVSFTIYGPRGDSIVGQAPGESMDSGDKGTAKAMSVALRTFLLQALCLPTQDQDPDASAYERATEAQAQATQKAAELWGRATRAQTVAEVRGIWQEATAAGLTGEELILDQVSGERKPIAPALKALGEAMAAFEPPAPSGEASPATTDTGPAPLGTRMASAGQHRMLNAIFNNCAVKDRDDRLAYLTALVDRPVETSKSLTAAEMKALLGLLAGVTNAQELDTIVGGAAARAREGDQT